jgi:hypothetical protein
VPENRTEGVHTMKVYQRLAVLFQAIENCKKSNNTDWLERHTESIIELVDRYMPSGSGIDTGTKFNFETSKPNKLVFSFGYHHMDENGYYDGWTEHTLIVTPSLAFDFDMRITGRNRNSTKEYLYEVFQFALSESVES